MKNFLSVIMVFLLLFSSPILIAQTASGGPDSSEKSSVPSEKTQGRTEMPQGQSFKSERSALDSREMSERSKGKQGNVEMMRNFQREKFERIQDR